MGKRINRCRSSKTKGSCRVRKVRQLLFCLQQQERHCLDTCKRKRFTAEENTIIIGETQFFPVVKYNCPGNINVWNIVYQTIADDIVIWEIFRNGIRREKKIWHI